MRKERNLFWAGYSKAMQHNKGKGWTQIEIESDSLFNYYFVCKSCNATLPVGFVVSPRFCPYCGKENE